MGFFHGLLVLGGAYLLGSIPFGMILARRFHGIDVREGGSKNIGAANVARLVGRPMGVATLVLDAAKGFFPVLLVGFFFADSPRQDALVYFSFHAVASIDKTAFWVAATGLAALLGHCYPVWLRFRGGKGVATALGVMLGVAPLAAVAGLMAFAIVVAVFRVASIGSIIGVALSVPVAYLTGGVMPAALAATMGVVVILRHHENFRRLMSRSEHEL